MRFTEGDGIHFTRLFRPGDSHFRVARRHELRLDGEPVAFANVGINHPDYGLTPREHCAAKVAREKHLGHRARPGVSRSIDLGAVRAAG